MGQEEYCELEGEKADLFLFMKHCMPHTFDEFSNVASPAPEKKPSALTAFNKRLIGFFQSRIIGKKDRKMIEVFDVLLKTRQRLSIIDPNTGEDILFGEEYYNSVR